MRDVTLSQLCDRVADTMRIERPKVRHYARVLQMAGMQPTGKSGRNGAQAPKVDPIDAAVLLLALCLSPTAAEAPAILRRAGLLTFSGLTTTEALPDGSGSIVREVEPAHRLAAVLVESPYFVEALGVLIGVMAEIEAGGKSIEGFAIPTRIAVQVSERFGVAGVRIGVVESADEISHRWLAGYQFRAELPASASGPEYVARERCDTAEFSGFILARIASLYAGEGETQTGLPAEAATASAGSA